MPYLSYDLPPYPCTRDIWDVLADEKRPILIYGMGNGADKLIDRFQKLNIKFSDIFASDGFVRGHSFHGIRVKSFSEVRMLYPEFVIVLSFASNRPEVIEMLSEIDRQYDMYIPDMPIADGEYFDKAFYNANYEKITEAYSLLADESSRRAFAAAVSYKLTGRLEYLLNSYSEKSELYSLISKNREIKTLIDCGAYTGDTLREAIEYFPSLCEAHLIEPDKKTFSRLLKKTAEIKEVSVSAYNAAVYSKCTTGSFQGSGNRNSSISSTASHEFDSQEVELISVDSLSLRIGHVDYIKYDVEGAELEALVGTHNTLISEKPVLLVSLYHKSRDVFSLVLYIKEKYPDYKLYIRRLLSVPAWELNLIAIP